MNDGDQIQHPSHAVLYITLGWIFTGLSLLIIPILFGAGGFIMGALLYKLEKRHAHGIILMALSVACAILGMLIGFMIGARLAS